MLSCAVGNRFVITLMMCCLCCRPLSQPYVMASGVTKPGTSNGYPMKAQLQIIGECLVTVKVDKDSS